MIDPATNLETSDTNGSHPDLVLEALNASQLPEIKQLPEEITEEG